MEEKICDSCLILTKLVYNSFTSMVYCNAGNANSSQIYYSFVIYTRVTNKATKYGNTYTDITYVIVNSAAKANVIWFTKKNGNSCGISV